MILINLLECCVLYKKRRCVAFYVSVRGERNYVRFASACAVDVRNVNFAQQDVVLKKSVRHGRIRHV